MYFTRRIASVSLMLSILGFWQPTLADPGNFSPWRRQDTPAPWAKNRCLGGFVDKFRLSGEVNQASNFTLQKLTELRDTIKTQNPSAVTELTVSFQTGSGPRTETYYGVTLWDLINNTKAGGGLKPGNSGQNTKNAFLRQYVLVEATDCYGAVVAVGEIHPNFENKSVLVAFAKKASDGTVQLLTDEGFARLVVPGDRAGGRYVSNVRNIVILSAPPSPLELKDFRYP
ncbi:hypothetical protein H6G80_20435 [Nostoc sp. FACHB-87]|uniref:hypothetical protein n=1 Tax=Nostocaceae TaxID=1162 RepID=UPI001682285F|nr:MULTISPECIES: hypothetical protein [Nostocaceae]MBD2298424.1 hypothetical protein [Nostoc sp. FACHB-190]MBD2456432.1 hypothetical protein [Nostoc sp. FACHB-87]MBD2474025.1 hypothetical protein [Anabaena sp. FACHB-83]